MVLYEPAIHRFLWSRLIGQIPLFPQLNVSTLYVRKKRRQQSNRRQERAHAIHKLDARRIRQLAQHRRADPAQAEREPEEEPRDRADPSRNQLLRVNHDRRERGREKQPHHHRNQPVQNRLA